MGADRASIKTPWQVDANVSLTSAKEWDFSKFAVQKPYHNVMAPIKSDDFIQQLLAEKCKKLEGVLDGEVILIRAPMQGGLDDAVRREIEALKEEPGCRTQLYSESRKTRDLMG